MMKKSVLIFVIVLVLIVMVLGIYFLNSGGSPDAGSSARSNQIGINNFAYLPSAVTVSQGTTLTWTNEDSAPHTVTSDSGSELDSETLNQGDTYSHTFTEKGTFNYHCTFHTSMRARVIVE